MPAHDHPHHIGLMRAGRFIIGIGNDERNAQTGDALIFHPASGAIIDEEVALIDIFTPLREDSPIGIASVYDICDGKKKRKFDGACLVAGPRAGGGASSFRHKRRRPELNHSSQLAAGYESNKTLDAMVVAWQRSQ